ncbi:MAG: class I SAM-dependent methyltransferase [Candidatus Manganitrophaceae bacterium]
MAFEFFDRLIRLPANAAQFAQRISGVHDNWLMTDAERGTLRALMSTLKPQCAIEVGVYRAGSLAILAEFCQKVYALDIDPYCQSTYASQFPNVEFITGSSQDTLPGLIDRLQATGEGLDFVLIDADHSAEGVRRDINNVLRYRPHRPLYIIMHDSFNPGCRSGMMKATWSGNPHVHMVELDFVVGRFVTQKESNDYREMWCGLGLGILLPERRVGDVIIHENEALTYQAALRHSVYRFHKWWNPFYSIPQATHGARRVAGQLLRTHAPRLFETLKARYSKSA